MVRWIAPLTAMILIAQQVGGIATRDAMFLSYFPVANLPILMAVSALISFPAAHWSGRLLARYGPNRLVPVSFGLSGCLFVFEFWLFTVEPKAASVLLYLHSTTIGSLVISAFWSLLNERFDPHSAKQMLSNVAVGAALGGLLGGIGTAHAGAWLPPAALLLLLAACSVLCIAGVLALGHGRAGRAQHVEEKEPAVRSGWAEIRRVPYLTDLAIVVTHAACLATLVDFVFKAEVAGQFARREDLLRFFGLFYAGTGVAAFLVQALLGGAALRRLGLAGAVASHPVTVGAATFAGLFLPPPWRGILPRGADLAVRNSIFRAGYELSYTPLAESSKRSAKAIIDVGLDCLGKGIGAGLILLLAFIAPGEAGRWVNLAAILAATAAELLATRPLRKGYVGALEADMRRRGGEVNKAADLTLTDFTMARSFIGLDRDSVLNALNTASAPLAANEPTDPLIRAIVDLRSEDRRKIRRALKENTNQPAITGFVIPLLARKDVVREVVAHLRSAGPAVAGQLTDALLNPEMPEEIRRRLPIVLQSMNCEQSVIGLVAALKDPSFDVRLRCSKALLTLTDAHPQFELPIPALLAQAEQELDAPSIPDRLLDHVFNLLALSLDRGPFRIARQAVDADDPYLRGTALEYLETVLPPSLFLRLKPALGISGAPSTKGRKADQIKAELLRMHESMAVPQKDEASSESDE